MSDSSELPWSSDPNAPQIPYSLYSAEKSNFAGGMLSTILYGVVVAQFCQCMSALFSRTRRDIKWGLVIHTVLMFSCATIYTVGGLYPASISYIDNREFPGTGGLPPGPVGYQYLVASDPFNTLCFFIVYLNQWLADGLLLYRCCVIFSMNYWFLALPCLVYLASVAMGIVVFDYEALRPGFATNNRVLSISFSLISVLLNVFLTLMIVIRLVLHKRNTRNALGTAYKSDGLYNTVVTMLIESCAISAVTYVLYIAVLVTKNPNQLTFYPLLIMAQVIGPFLIIERVANRTALTSEVISGNVGSMHFRSRAGGSTIGDGTFPDGDRMSSVDADGVAHGERVGTESIHSISEVASAR